jgi:magnesium transporter
MAKKGITNYMTRVLKKPSKEKGLPPGTLVFVGSQRMEKSLLRLMEYNKKTLIEKQINDLSELSEAKNQEILTWLNIDGVHEVDVMEKIGTLFDLDPILLADIMHTGQRPRIVEYDNCIFIVLCMLRFDKESGGIISEQLSIIIGDHYLLTFQEQNGDLFEPVRNRIRNGRKRIRSSGPDFLAYTLFDVVADNYIYIAEVLEEEIENLEENLNENPSKEILSQISHYKKEINLIRRKIRPVREIMIQIPKIESPILKATTLGYWNGLQVQIMLANESIDAHRDMIGDQLNLYHSIMSTKMNDVMKVLTIFSAIFIPLTFIAGIYGTNFDVLPELHYEHSYYIMLGIMFIVVLIMLSYFKAKKWY